ncbi:MAG: DNA translocase FtsK 4TM domain-containing protein [Defluviitaleaceae bacterium]|nr:DNA translocase FtsK 4TM domain-containing protein [Defluviitaleaceae bacterium]
MADIPKNRNKNTEDKFNYYVCGGIGIFLGLTTYIDGFLGFLGGFFSGILLGLFGVAGYFIPVMLIVIAGVNIFFDIVIASKLFIAKFIALMLIFIAFAHIFAVQNQEDVDFWPNLQMLYSQGGADNGGLIGGLIGNLLRNIVGETVAIVLLVIAAIAVLVLISLPIIIKFWPNFSDNANDLFDDDEDDINDVNDENPEYTKPPSRFPSPVNYESHEPKKPTKKPTKTSPAAKSPKQQPAQRIQIHQPTSQPRKHSVININEESKRQDGKILLFHEEMKPIVDKPPTKKPKEPKELEKISPIKDLATAEDRMKKILNSPKNARRKTDGVKIHANQANAEQPEKLED